LLFPLAVFAQDQKGPLNFSSAAGFAVGEPARPTASEPWRIIPKGDLQEIGKGKEVILFDESNAPIPESNPDAQLVTGATCYAIRSYVVARDDKESDSTHFVRYSTCQPASRYRLKTAQVEGSTAKLR
jgi:hypothetical protein